MNTIPRTRITHDGTHKVTYIERKALFGLIKWWQKINTEYIGSDLIIESSVEIIKIYLNEKLVYENPTTN